MINSHAVGVSNEAHTLESSSIQIYSELQTGLNTELGWYKAALIEW
jgi:hypothetical protein